MTVTQNQLDTIFNTQLGRNATPYEAQTYSNASPQALAGLKDAYSKLNTGSSIVDYLTSIGEDPSLSSRTALGQKYGITNVGTSEGNTALLTALKSGKAPTPAAPPAVPGSITPPATIATPNVTSTQNGPASVPGSLAAASGGSSAPALLIPGLPASATVYRDNGSGSYTAVENGTGRVLGSSTAIPNGQYIVPSSNATAPGNDANGTPVTDTSSDGSSSGSSSGSTALSTDPTNPLSDPDISSLKTAYTAAQGNVAQIDSQVANLRSIMASALSDKIKQAAAGGGVEDRAQLASEAAFENQGIQSQIDSLMAQRSQYATAQSQAGTAYQDAVADFYKSATLGQGQEKIDNQSQQFVSKLEQSGWKSTKVNQYDEYGNVVGQATVWTQNPSDKTGYTADGSQVSISQGSSGPGISPASPSGPASAASSSSSVPATAPLATGSSVDVSAPGYTTATVTYGGKDTQLTQAYIDQTAIAAIMNGGTIPSSANRGTKGLPLVQSNAIKARIGQLDPGGNLALNKTEAQAWGSAISTQIAYATQLSRSLNSADADMQQIISKYQGTGINDDTMPISNIIANASKYQLGDGDVSALKASLSELSRLYSQVFSNGGQTTDATNKTASDIIDGNLSIANLQKVATQLQALGKVDVDQANQSIQSAESQYKGIALGGSSKSSLSPDDVNYTLKSVAGGDGYVSPEDYNKMKTLYVDNGGTAADFDEEYGSFKNPKNNNY